MNSFVAPDIAAPSSLQALDWRCRGMVFSWHGRDGIPDAAATLAAFDLDPTQLLRHKFPTPSMPWQAWARGRGHGAVVELRLGFEGDQCEMHVKAETDEPLAEQFDRFRKSVRTLQQAPGIVLSRCGIAVDLELDRPGDVIRFARWNRLSTWEEAASVVRREYLLSAAGGRINLSVAAALDQDHHRAELSVGAIYKDSADGDELPLFAVLERFLALDSIAELRRL